MLLKDFEAFVDGQQKACVAVLDKKGVEYAGTGDRLSSFRQPSTLTKKAPEAIWLGYWSKGIVALYDNIAAGTEINPELILDAINYLYLFRSLLTHTDGSACSREELMAEVQKQFDLCKNVLVEKAKTYCKDDDDRLGMFKRMAAITLTTPEDVLGSYMTKHTNSIIQGVRNQEISIDFWNEKITDHINYLFLLGAIAAEKAAPVVKKTEVKSKKADKKAEPVPVATTEPALFEIDGDPVDGDDPVEVL